MSRLCEGRVVIVTGAGRGLGRDYAKLLAAQGAKLVVNDLGGAADGSGADRAPAEQVVDEIRAAGGEAVVNFADVADFDAAKGMIEAAVKTYGRLDVLINNAGILRDRMLVNMSEAEWDVVVRVHLKGTFAPSRHAAAYWRDRAKEADGPLDARIINTTSASGIYGNPGQTNYGAAKMGIAGFTIIAARELKRIGVTVNAICPAAFTRLTEPVMKLTAEQKELYDPRYVAPLAVWLASRASAGVTGRVFEAGGGTISIAEGWHRGPAAPQTEDPVAIGPVLAALVAKARLNTGIHGNEVED
jgi:NAD(P)-dependent dehydrogenase (short-subunit alcohol dehydrogenase family)